MTDETLTAEETAYIAQEHHLAHLKLISGVIDRMGYMGLGVMVTAAVIAHALITAQTNPLVGAAVLTALWGVDAFFLRMEQEYRRAYGAKAGKLRNIKYLEEWFHASFSLNPNAEEFSPSSDSATRRWFKAMRSPVKIAYYNTLMVAVGLAYAF